jgi:GTP-binding protein HflX
MHYQETKPRILIVGIQAPYNTNPNAESYFEEFRNLIASNNLTFDAELYIKLRTIDAGTFITRGHLDKIKQIIDAQDIDHIIISEPLSPQQERNLRDYLHRPVFDRTRLILDIFEKNAHSAEAKAQIGIALLEFQKSRLAGKGAAMSQQAGVRGVLGGFGETAKEKERRHLEAHILKLKRELDQLHKTRETQRKQRLRTKQPLICLIGYTNTGKSTILNALTKSNVLAQDQLFATLDTTTRELYLNKKKIGLISDTVGFIQLLPHQLIDAFKSTLSELQYADLLLHVVDISDANWQQHIELVNHIITDLQVDTKSMLYVFNKADKIEITPALQEAIERYQPHVIVSATSKEGLHPLTDYLFNYQFSK